jgi:hypothetical protein
MPYLKRSTFKDGSRWKEYNRGIEPPRVLSDSLRNDLNLDEWRKGVI